MDLREWQRLQVARSEAHIVLSNLQANPAEALTGLTGVTHAARHARHRLRQAKLQAANSSAPEPDNPEAAISCGWCGNSKFMELANDGAEDGPEEWFCKDLAACQAKRTARYPDKQTEELKMAWAEEVYWRHAATAATLALTAWRQSPGRP